MLIAKRGLFQIVWLKGSLDCGNVVPNKEYDENIMSFP